MLHMLLLLHVVLLRPLLLFQPEQLSEAALVGFYQVDPLVQAVPLQPCMHVCSLNRE
jgi:hypothetical protein